MCVRRVGFKGEDVQEARLLATFCAKGGSQRGPGCLLDAIKCHAHHGVRSIRCCHQKLVYRSYAT